MSTSIKYTAAWELRPRNDISISTAVFAVVTNTHADRQTNNNNNDRLTAFDPGQPG